MHFDIHLRNDVAGKIKGIVQELHDWNVSDTLSVDEIDALSEYVQGFDHCAKPDRPFLISGADGSGDFPCVTYGDSVVYLVTAMARLYEASTNKLIERKTTVGDIVELLWLPADSSKAKDQYKDFFAKLMNESLETVCQDSDFFTIARANRNGTSTPLDLIDNLITPEAHDADNIGIQLRSTAEAGMLVRLMKSLDTANASEKPVYILEDTTMALPMLSSKQTLFFAIAKRYACRVARDKGIYFMTLSKSHNMPHIDLIEDMVKTIVPSGEHWFLRLPLSDEKVLEFLGKRSLPPAGAVTYIFKFHKTTQPMRVDMDYDFWSHNVWNTDKDVMRKKEIQIFRDLDFASHDQRCYGYPYPIKACHDMVSMTKEERVAFRKIVVDEAIKTGLKRKNFVDPSIQTGHA